MRMPRRDTKWPSGGIGSFAASALMGRSSARSVAGPAARSPRAAPPPRLAARPPLTTLPARHRDPARDDLRLERIDGGLHRSGDLRLVAVVVHPADAVLLQSELLH